MRNEKYRNITFLYSRSIYLKGTSEKLFTTLGVGAKLICKKNLRLKICGA